jgi:hypothetical protein
VLPDAPRPSLRLFEVPMLLELRSLPPPEVLPLRPLEAPKPLPCDDSTSESGSVRVDDEPMPSSPWLPRSVRLVPDDPDEPEDPDEPDEPADWLRPLWLF